MTFDDDHFGAGNFRIPYDVQTPWGHERLDYESALGSYIVESGTNGVESDAGDFYVFIVEGSVIKQTITGLIIGRSYTVSWSQRTFYGFDTVEGGIISVFIGVRNVYPNGVIGTLDWVSQTSEDYVAVSDTAELIFSTPNPGPAGPYINYLIDNVVLTLVPLG
jgi:hypothetical protein